MKILIHFPFNAEQVTALTELARGLGDHEVVHAEDEATAGALAPGAQVILGYFPEPVTSVAPDLRWVQSFSAGMDKFLYPSIIAREEVVVSNMAGLYAPQGGEHAWALLLGLSRGVLAAARSIAQKTWGGAGDMIELTGGTLGLIGLGGFGIETAKRSAGYDMRVIALDPVRLEAPPGVEEVRPPSPGNLLWLLSAADAVVISCPLTPQTHHLIGAEQLAAMKPTAYLVCVSRGGIIDEEALDEALRSGTIAGAGLDVCETEPLPQGSPLWTAPNLILTPHRAGASQHRSRKTFEFFRDNLERYLKGDPVLNIVDKARGY